MMTKKLKEAIKNCNIEESNLKTLLEEVRAAITEYYDLEIIAYYYDHSFIIFFEESGKFTYGWYGSGEGEFDELHGKIVSIASCPGGIDESYEVYESLINNDGLGDEEISMMEEYIKSHLDEYECLLNDDGVLDLHDEYTCNYCDLVRKVFSKACPERYKYDYDIFLEQKVDFAMEQLIEDIYESMKLLKEEVALEECQKGDQL